MENFTEEHLEILEMKATEIRKLLLGTLLLAKDVWREELNEKKDTEVIEAIEEAEDSFVDNSITDRFKRLENILNVIHKRSRGLFFLMEYAGKMIQKAR